MPNQKPKKAAAAEPAAETQAQPSRGRAAQARGKKNAPKEAANTAGAAAKQSGQNGQSKTGSQPKKRGRTSAAQKTQQPAQQKGQNGQGAQAKNNGQSAQDKTANAGQSKANNAQGAKKNNNTKAAAAKTADAAKSTGTKRRSRGAGKVQGQNGPLVRIVPLGGLGEVGKNLNVIECGSDSFILDCGMTFPDDSMPGVDLVIPDFTYVLENKDKIKGIFITHGHEDHIGGIPFLLKQAKFPIYGTKLTLGLLENKLKEHGLLGRVKLNVVKPGDIIKLDQVEIEFINVNHSIPDACAIAMHTPAGVIVHTGDFKIDFTPIRGDVINLARFGELGSQGVLALLSDSTNSERPGSTPSERTVGISFDKIFQNASKKRIVVATFSSNVHRVQQIVDAAVKQKRKIAVNGRSMENVVNKALEIGYLDIPSGVLVDVDSINKYPPEKMVIITTGSQGEPMSALTRMAMGDHRKITVGPNDCIIISATPIPGNEKLVTRVVNELLKLGCEVVYEKMFDVHVSGHACQDEQKLMIALTKPKFFLPMHGEFKHLKKHAETAYSMGIDPKNVLISEIGKVVELTPDSMKFGATVPAGKVFVDGIGVGDVGSIVLRDRKHLAEDGLIVVVTTVNGKTGEIMTGPDIVSRGFVYVRESEDMIGKARNIAKDTIKKCMINNTREWGTLKQKIRDDVGDYLWQMTKRSPMILPVIQEVYE